jgi:hypothetical protein
MTSGEEGRLDFQLLMLHRAGRKTHSFDFLRVEEGQSRAVAKSAPKASPLRARRAVCLPPAGSFSQLHNSFPSSGETAIVSKAPYSCTEG